MSVPRSRQIFQGIIIALLLAAGGTQFTLNFLKSRNAEVRLDKENRRPPQTVTVVNIWADDPTRTPDGGYVPRPIRPR